MTHFPSRRTFLRLAGFAAAASLASACRPWTKEPLAVALPTPTPRGPDPLESNEALERLLTGNLRFVANYRQYPGQSLERMAQVAESQHPFAAVLTCADSRVPPELLFDQGLGDLFVVRVAGNVADDEIIGSLEYAVEHLGVRLLMVLGHERCGAVRAALETLAAQTRAPGHIQGLVKELQPPVQAVLPATDEDALDQAIRLNIAHVLRQTTERSQLLSRLVEQRKLQLVGGYYDLDTGVVELIG